MAKHYYQSNKEKLQKRLQEYYINLSEQEKIKKRKYPNIRNKNMADTDREKKKMFLLTNKFLNIMKVFEFLKVESKSFTKYFLELFRI